MTCYFLAPFSFYVALKGGLSTLRTHAWRETSNLVCSVTRSILTQKSYTVHSSSFWNRVQNAKGFTRLAFTFELLIMNELCLEKERKSSFSSSPTFYLLFYLPSSSSLFSEFYWTFTNSLWCPGWLSAARMPFALQLGSCAQSPFPTYSWSSIRRSTFSSTAPWEKSSGGIKTWANEVNLRLVPGGNGRIFCGSFFARRKVQMYCSEMVLLACFAKLLVRPYHFQSWEKMKVDKRLFPLLYFWWWEEVESSLFLPCNTLILKKSRAFLSPSPSLFLIFFSLSIVPRNLSGGIQPIPARLENENVLPSLDFQSSLVWRFSNYSVLVLWTVITWKIIMNWLGGLSQQRQDKWRSDLWSERGGLRGGKESIHLLNMRTERRYPKVGPELCACRWSMTPHLSHISLIHPTQTRLEGQAPLRHLSSTLATVYWLRSLSAWWLGGWSISTADVRSGSP